MANEMLGKIKVTIHQNGTALKEVEFDEFPVLIGRSPDCAIRFPDSPFVSRQHSAISLDGDQIIIKDLGSTNGIKVNGDRRDLIKAKDTLNFFIENLEFRVQLESPEVINPELTNISVIRAPIRPDQSNEPEGHFTVAPFYQITQVPLSQRALQVVLTWEQDIHSVHNFEPNEPIILGNTVTESIYLPLVTKSVDFGRFQGDQALIRLSKATGWTVFQDKEALSQHHIVDQKKLIKEKGTQNLILKMQANEVMSLDLGNDLMLHFRFVKKPAYYLPKTLIENKEETQKALGVSALFHAAIAIIALLMTPKIEAPKIQNVPPRVAKLLVEPPPQVIPPEPEPELEPEPEPELPKEPEPPKPKPPEPPKKIPPKERPKPLPPKKVPPKPVVQKPIAQVSPRPPSPKAESQVSNPPKAPANPKPAPLTKEQKEAQELANMLNQLPGPAAKGPGVNKGAPIQIDSSRVSANGIKVSGIATAAKNIQSQGGVVGGGSPDGFSIGTGTGGSGTGKGGPIGLSKTGQTGVAGKQGVKGAVLGTPKLAGEGIPASQGLTNDVVMSVVNRYLGDIQRCYERALFEDSTLAGRIEYEWNISPSGQVTSTRVVSSQMARSDILNNCVLGVFKKMKFPKSTNGQPTIAKIGFPFGK